MKHSLAFLLPGFLLLSACTLPFAAAFPARPTESTAGVQTSIVETLTAWPASAQSNATSALPTRTGVLPTPTLPAPTFTPTRTLSPTPALPSLTPEQFVRYYFNNINISNYPLTWSLLSERFKAAVNGPSQGGYEGYVNFWNTVHSVKVESVTVISQDSDYASIKVTMLIHYNDEVLATSTVAYTLVNDHLRHTWLFDSTPTLTSTPSKTASRTVTQTASPSGTPTPSRTFTNTPSLTSSPTETATVTDTPTPSPTSSETATSTFTSTP